MEAKAIIKIYADASPGAKVDIICKNYPNFLGILDGYTEGLLYKIENEKEYNKKADCGELGVRVQSSGRCSDKTATQAINNVITRDASHCQIDRTINEFVKREFFPQRQVLERERFR